MDMDYKEKGSIWKQQRQKKYVSLDRIIHIDYHHNIYLEEK